MLFTFETFVSFSVILRNLMLGSGQCNNDFTRSPVGPREKSLSSPEEGLQPENGAEGEDCSDL